MGMESGQELDGMEGFEGEEGESMGSRDPDVHLGENAELGDQEEDEEEDEEDAIDITNPDDLAKRGLQRIQIESEQEEFLLDQEGNIYNLQGEFVGTIDNDGKKSEAGTAYSDSDQ